MKIIITSPSLDPSQNVSGISSVTQFIIKNNLRANYIHFELGRKDNEAGGILRVIAIGKALLHWNKLLSQYPEAVVHYNFPLSMASILRDPLFIFIAWIRRHGMVIHLHGGNFLTAKYIPRCLKLLLKKIFSLPVPFIVLSNLERNIIQEKFDCKDKNVFVLPNCIDLKDAIDYKRKINVDSPLNIGYLGRIAETKGMGYLLEACTQMKAKGKRFSLRIAGKEEVKGQYLPLFSKYLDEQFEYVGVVSGESKSRFLKSLDVFVLPSYFEGLPMSLIESMSFGVVPVTTPVGSIPEVVKRDENGLFIKLKDSESIMQKIASLDRDRNLLQRLSNKAQVSVLNNFDAKAYICELNKIYEKACPRRSTPNF